MSHLPVCNWCGENYEKVPDHTMCMYDAYGYPEDFEEENKYLEEIENQKIEKEKNTNEITDENKDNDTKEK